MQQVNQLGFLDDLVDRPPPVSLLHVKAQDLPGCRIGQQELIALVGDQDGIWTGGQDRFQALAPDLGSQEEACVRSCQSGLPAQGDDETDLFLGEGVRLVVGNPE